MVTEARVREELHNVVDPELGFSIIDLGLVYKITVKEKTVHVQMTFTSPACPVGPLIIADVKRALEAIPGVEHADVEITFDPLWGPEKASGEIRALFEQQL